MLELITDRLHEISAADPRRELIVDPVYGRLSYGDAAEQVGRLAAALHQHDIGAGDVVILQLPNWAPFLIFHLALSQIGAVTATIPIVYREHEIRSVAGLSDAKAIVTPAVFSGFDYAAMAERVREDCASLKHIFLVGGGEAQRKPGMISYEEMMRRPWEGAGAAGAGSAAKPSLEDITSLGFTSGTTGVLKAAMFNTRILAATNLGLKDRYGLNEGDRIFGCSPLGHAVGFTHALRMTLTIGGSICLLDRWDPAKALAQIEAEKCTFIAAATPFLMDLVYHPDLKRRGSLSSVRLFLCGGASIPATLMHDARQGLAHTFTSPLWGMTECGGVTTCPFDAPKEKLFTTDGLPCGGMELKVVDQAGETVPCGTDGELMARGPMVTRGYFKQPELTAQHFLVDGFFRTGDQARMDQDGYIKITGRLKDLVIRGGVNISPVEIENVLFGHPSVANVAIVGMPDPRLGERICAFVILQPGGSLELADVQKWMAGAGVAKQKWPERIEIVSAFPMTPSGKIQKFRMREMIAETVTGNKAAAVPGAEIGEGGRREQGSRQYGAIA
jgi:acyl-CoA synthetase (AMP-forming)/AMP-acid ligase II